MLPIVIAILILIPALHLSVMAQDSSSINVQQVEQTILEVVLPQTFDDAFVEQGLLICHAYNALTYEEKMSVSKEVNDRYAEILTRVAFAMQQSVEKLVGSDQPESELFQPTMEIESQIVNLQWNFQQKINNLDRFEQLRINLRDGYLNDGLIPNYYIRTLYDATEAEYQDYQQSIVPEAVSSQPDVPPITSKPPVVVHPIAPVVVPKPNVSSSSAASSVSSAVSSEEVTSSQFTESSVSSETSSAAVSSEPPASSQPTAAVSEPPLSKPKPSLPLNANSDINLVAVYVAALVGVLVAIFLVCAILWNSDKTSRT